LPKKSIPQNIDSEARAIAELARDDIAKSMETVLGGLLPSRTLSLVKQFESAANILGPTLYTRELTKVGSTAMGIISKQLSGASARPSDEALKAIVKLGAFAHLLDETREAIAKLESSARPSEEALKAIAKLGVPGDFASLRDNLPNILEASTIAFGLSNQSITATLTSFASNEIISSSVREQFNKAFRDIYSANASLTKFSTSLPNTSWIKDLQYFTAPYVEASFITDTPTFPNLLGATAGIIAQQMYIEVASTHDTEGQDNFVEKFNNVINEVSASLPASVRNNIFHLVTIFLMILPMYMDTGDTRLLHQIANNTEEPNILSEQTNVLLAEISNSSESDVLIAKRTTIVRTKPERNAITKVVLPQDSTVEKIEQSEGWVYIKYRDPGDGDYYYGWVARRNLILPRNYPRYIEAMQQRESNIPEE